ncbi:MAG: hypothetical protein H8E22_04995 [Candidatus Cloacimonetes bacterium]|nr:hypothetical protein [Candidatus Cloacimonadota bacterium]
MKKILLIIILIALSLPLFADEPGEFGSDAILQNNIKYGWDNATNWENSRIDLQENMTIFKQWENKKQSHLTNCLKSMIAPGWGHFSTRNYLKGEILLGLQVLLAGSAYYFYDQSQDYYEKYQNAHQIDEINQYYIDANASYSTSGILVGLWIIVWGYTVLDTIQSTEDYNRDLWFTLYDEYMNSKVTVTAHGIQIRF